MQKKCISANVSERTLRRARCPLPINGSIFQAYPPSPAPSSIAFLSLSLSFYLSLSFSLSVWLALPLVRACRALSHFTPSYDRCNTATMHFFPSVCTRNCTTAHTKCSTSHPSNAGCKWCIVLAPVVGGLHCRFHFAAVVQGVQLLRCCR